MKIRFVDRSDIKISRKSKSKYRPLKEAIADLEPGGDAVQVKFSDEKELISLRNVIYTYNRETGSNVRSSADMSKNIIFFYVE
ncbi:MAG: hypothetical protein GVY07_02400 [Bacteroidetes bacterium]|jgi:hypothetical protein|nr:hypothetical protein [Bacteroidota bacterium]